MISILLLAALVLVAIVRAQPPSQVSDRPARSAVVLPAGASVDQAFAGPGLRDVQAAVAQPQGSREERAKNYPVAAEPLTPPPADELRSYEGTFPEMPVFPGRPH
ncbi:MAG TPA: hypothetical protein VMU89_20285 [Thermomicrobiaceae bacterium]|nr:hypothetical protein [Thermomicrobiaceae bacterium]